MSALQTNIYSSIAHRNLCAGVIAEYASERGSHSGSSPKTDERSETRFDLRVAKLPRAPRVEQEQARGPNGFYRLGIE